MSRRRNETAAEPLTAAVLLGTIEKTGAHLIKLCGVASASMVPNAERIPRNVMLEVLSETNALLSHLNRHLMTWGAPLDQTQSAPKP